MHSFSEAAEQLQNHQLLSREEMHGLSRTPLDKVVVWLENHLCIVGVSTILGWVQFHLALNMTHLEWQVRSVSANSHHLGAGVVKLDALRKEATPPRRQR
jgi:hypothetical protein